MSAPASSPRLRALRSASRRRGRGFTLIELSVALVAGLLVAMALVQVSKEANNTFHEEVRAAAAEMSLRVTLERLRSDLQRVAYMSTGNIVADPGCAVKKGLVGCTSNMVTPVQEMSRLQGVRLAFGGSTATAPLSTNANNGLNPDAIDLAGNFSSTDEFGGYVCPGPPAGAGCGGQSICLTWNTPAMWRIRNSANPAQTLQSYFNPSFANANPAPGTTRFLARITDNTGRYQYVLTCGGAAATSFAAGGAAINIDPATKVLSTFDTDGRGGYSGFTPVVINPVQTVHWQIMQASAIGGGAAAVYQYGAASTVDPNEYVLVRQYVDAVNKTPDPATTEIVAEYAVDLKFAFTVDSQIPANNPQGAYLPGATPLLYLQLDNNVNQNWAYDVATQPASQQGPQRIRSVRVRAAIRTQFADRSVTIPVTPNTAQPYLYRYYLNLPGTPSLDWARVRTGVTEVWLPNQTRFYF